MRRIALAGLISQGRPPCADGSASVDGVCGGTWPSCPLAAKAGTQAATPEELDRLTDDLKHTREQLRYTQTQLEAAVKEAVAHARAAMMTGKERAILVTHMV